MTGVGSVVCMGSSLEIMVETSWEGMDPDLYVGISWRGDGKYFAAT